MRAAYLFSVWVHILAAITWIGGILFLVLVVVPWLRGGNQEQGARFLRETGIRFRTVGWCCFAVLVVTGSFNLWMRGVRPGHFTDPGWLTSSFGKAVTLKIGLFMLVLAVSAVHDFVLGPRAAALLETNASSPEAQNMRRAASRLGRANALLALLLVAVGVVLVRGWPW